LAPSKSELKVIEKLVEASCNAPLKWERRRVRKLSDLEELLRPPSTSFWWRLLVREIGSYLQRIFYQR
jgi:hypothetical protein